MRVTAFTGKILISTSFTCLIFLAFLFLTACLNPTMRDEYEYAGRTVNLRDYTGLCDCYPARRARAGNQRIYLLCPYRYYMLEILDRDGSRGLFFINSDGLLVENLDEIGRVREGVIIGEEHSGEFIPLSNEQSFTYILRHALPLTGRVNYFDVANPANVNAFMARGELRISPAISQHRLDLYPILDPDFVSTYEMFTIPSASGSSPTDIPPPRRIDGDDRVTTAPGSFVIPVAIGAHEGEFEADYLFLRQESGNLFFNVLRVVPVFGLAVTVTPIRVDEGELPSFTPLGPIYVHQMGTTVNYARFMFYNPDGAFTDIEWRDERGNLIGTTANVQLHFTDPTVFWRYSLPGYHLFFLTATRYNLPWSAIVQLYVRRAP